jgi:hypothetical protein
MLGQRAAGRTTTSAAHVAAFTPINHNPAANQLENGLTPLWRAEDGFSSFSPLGPKTAHGHGSKARAPDAKWQVKTL